MDFISKKLRNLKARARLSPNFFSVSVDEFLKILFKRFVNHIKCQCLLFSINDDYSRLEFNVSYFALTCYFVTELTPNA